ncbi:MAG: hypothetical protein WC386_02900 [Candidatus Paceibacterota bacterium]|jgi:hypothetical protein
MNKKCKIIIAIVFILALIAVGFFYYNKVQEDRMGPVSFESFKKTETDGKVFMENKDIGLKFMVPEGWGVQNLTWSSISVVSQDFEPFTNPSPLPKKGCLININPEIQIEGSDYDLQYGDLKAMANDSNYLLLHNTDKEKYESIELSELKGVKSDFLIDNNINNVGNRIYEAVPYNNVIYYFETSIFGENKEECLQEFDNFLTTVFIKKK